ncbi:MAG: hypothetical protein ACYSUI_00010 [Planctomycetota bacterium]|jgi:endonuclease III
MKNGTAYARRVKRVYRKLRSAAKEPLPEEGADPPDPLDQYVLAMLGWETTPAQAARALAELTQHMVDLNEVRVATVREISTAIRNTVPNSMECARNISRSLNDIFRRENRVSLDSLRDKGRREARHYLESLQGAIPYATASVLLWSMGAHAMPVSRRLIDALRAEDLIDADAQPSEVQAFLERNIAASDAMHFCMTMERFADQHAAQSAPSENGKKKKKKTAKSAAAGAGTGRRKKKTARK